MSVSLETKMTRAFGYLFAVVIVSTCVTFTPGVNADEKKNAFDVPDGSTSDLLQYIEDVRKKRPSDESAAGTKKHFTSLYMAVIQATSKILTKAELTDLETRQAIDYRLNALGSLSKYNPKAADVGIMFAHALRSDERPEIAALGESHWLALRAKRVSTLDEDERDLLVEDFFEHVKKSDLDRAQFTKIRNFSRDLANAGAYDSAAQVSDKLAELAISAKDQAIVRYIPKLQGEARRYRSVGKSIVLDGVTASGKEFDWESYRGKVVLLDFWATWCGPCVRRLPEDMARYNKFKDQGFTMVAINMDSSREKMEAFIADKGIEWEQLVSFEKGYSGWSHPITSQFGISAIPSVMLVDQEGKVVALNVTGSKLDKLVEDLLKKNK
jgi:thiol-disulfide isomerase/thioredoxin